MLNVDLSQIRTIVTHGPDCPDGRASAIILKDALPSARVLFVQHGTPELRDLPAESGMLFCDICPPRERVEEFLASSACVLDHHRGQRDVAERFVLRGLGAFADEEVDRGVSGAMLAYEHVWSKVKPPFRPQRAWAFASDLALLAGIRDTWQRGSPRWEDACEHAAALRFWPIDKLFGATWVELDEMMRVGAVLRQKDAERDARSTAEADRFTVGGVRCIAFEGTWTSDIAERLADEVDLVLGWHYLVSEGRPRLVVSLRSRGDALTALELAKACGGGGHTAAAGFTLPAPTSGPYAYLRALVGDYLAAR